MATNKSTDAPALATPAGTDEGWQKKIERAKAAREDGKAIRAGKPTSFRSAVGRAK